MLTQAIAERSPVSMWKVSTGRGAYMHMRLCSIDCGIRFVDLKNAVLTLTDGKPVIERSDSPLLPMQDIHGKTG